MSAIRLTTSKRLIHNTLFNVITLVTQASINFVMVPFILECLGQQRNGVWRLMGSIFYYQGILSLGLNSAVNRYIPVYLARNDHDGIRRVISTSFFYYLFLAVIILLVTAVLYFNVGRWFAIEPELVDTARKLILVVGCCTAIAIPLQLSSAVLTGLQQYIGMNIAILIPLLIRTTVLVVILKSGYRLLAMGFLFGITEIFTRGLQFITYHKFLPGKLISIKFVDKMLLKNMLTYGTNTMMYTAGALIMFRASDIVIGTQISTIAVTRFAIASAAVVLLIQLMQAFTAAIKPAVSDLDARDDHGRINQISLLTQKYSLLILIPVSCLLIAMGREFLWLWVGRKFGDVAVINEIAGIMTVLVLAHGIRLSQHGNFLVLVGRGEHRIFGVFTITAAVLCVVFSVISVRVFGWGLLGVAWSNFLPMAIISGLVLQVYFNRRMKIGFRDCIMKVWWPALLGVFPAVALIIGWKLLCPPQTWVSFFTVTALAALCTLLGSWFLGLSTRERSMFYNGFVPAGIRRRIGNMRM